MWSPPIFPRHLKVVFGFNPRLLDDVVPSRHAPSKYEKKRGRTQPAADEWNGGTPCDRPFTVNLYTLIPSSLFVPVGGCSRATCFGQRCVGSGQSKKRSVCMWGRYLSIMLDGGIRFRSVGAVGPKVGGFLRLPIRWVYFAICYRLKSIAFALVGWRLLVAVSHRPCHQANSTTVNCFLTYVRRFVTYVRTHVRTSTSFFFLRFCRTRYQGRILYCSWGGFNYVPDMKY